MDGDVETIPCIGHLMPEDVSEINVFSYRIVKETLTKSFATGRGLSSKSTPNSCDAISVRRGMRMHVSPQICHISDCHVDACLLEWPQSKSVPIFAKLFIARKYETNGEEVPSGLGQVCRCRFGGRALAAQFKCSNHPQPEL